MRSPGREGQDVSALHLGPTQERLLQDLRLQQPHGLPPIPDIPVLLDGVCNVLVPPAVVGQRGVPARNQATDSAH